MLKPKATIIIIHLAKYYIFWFNLALLSTVWRAEIAKVMERQNGPLRLHNDDVR